MMRAKRQNHEKSPENRCFQGIKMVEAEGLEPTTH